MDFADCFALPKTELHCHLDGSVRAATMVELAAFADEETLKRAIRAGAVRDSLEDYLSAFSLTLSVLQDEKALERVMRELVIDCAAENVIRLETRFSPTLHRERGLRGEAIVEAVLSGMRQGVHAVRASGGYISSGLILCGIRHLPAHEADAVAALAVRYADAGVCGFDLAGPEVGYPAALHQAAFDRVHAAGLGITVHAGEAEGAWAVREAVIAQRASRVGHGTRIIDDEDIVALARERGLALEVCLQSNVETRSVPAIASHPFARLLREGLRVTLNTDNRLMSDTSVSLEYFRAAQAFSLSKTELLQVSRNGVEAAFVDAAERARLLARLPSRV